MHPVKEEKENKWGYFWSGIAINSLGHPVEYAKVLIQIGHEPIPPKPARTILGKPVLALPNVFQYVGYIKSVDGIVGCFRGLSGKLCTNIVSGITIQAVQEALENSACKYDYPEDSDSETARRKEFLDTLSTKLVAHTAGIILSHPFQVVAVRMMAEFVGGETKYSSITAAIVEIYRHEGFFGFFSGFFPRLIGDLLNVTLTAVFGAIVYKCLPEGDEMRNYATAISGFAATAITYPFNVVSNCMIVSTSGLVAGTSPRMPEYKSWLHCWAHLYRTDQLKRGSALLWRYYRGPYVLINGQPVMLNKDDFASTAKLRENNNH